MWRERKGASAGTQAKSIGVLPKMMDSRQKAWLDAPMARLVSLPAAERLGALVTVLDHVRTQGPATRSSLIAETGLTPAVVPQRGAELGDYGLLVDDALAPSTGGR